MKPFHLLTLIAVILFSCQSEEETPINNRPMKATSLSLDLEQANRLAQLPLSCIQQEYPNKMGAVYTNEADLLTPKVAHPAFYGCFDWHSAVHGHWVLVRLLKAFPNLENETLIRQQLAENLTKANIEQEMAYFELNAFMGSYERTYGWAWLLKLTEELYTWNDEQGKELYENISPLGTCKE